MNNQAFSKPRTRNFFSVRDKIWILVIIAVFLAGGILTWQYLVPKEETIKDIKKYLHKDAILREAAPPPDIEYQAISIEEAIFFAIQHLKDKGVKKIEICETHWIIAPLGGFLIDEKGDFSIGGKRYSTFRIGVRDGSEANGDKGELAGGKEFVFIARGEDEKGNVIWYPEPGPDYQPAEGKVYPEEFFTYQFLGGRKERQRFETLSHWCK